MADFANQGGCMEHDICRPKNRKFIHVLYKHAYNANQISQLLCGSRLFCLPTHVKITKRCLKLYQRLWCAVKEKHYLNM